MGIFLEASLLRVLQYFNDQDSIGFVELSRKLEFSTDLTGYYIRRLERKAMIEKIDRGTYRITGFGKSILTHLPQLNELSRPRISILLIARQDDAVLIRKRSIQPYINHHEWLTRPLRSDETIQQAVSILAFRLTEQPITPVFSGFFRQTDILNDTIFDDKLFAVHTANIDGDTPILKTTKAGVTLVIPDDRVQLLSKPSASLTDIWGFAKSQDAYREQTYYLSNDDIY